MSNSLFKKVPAKPPIRVFTSKSTDLVLSYNFAYPWIVSVKIGSRVLARIDIPEKIPSFPSDICVLQGFLDQKEKRSVVQVFKDSSDWWDTNYDGIIEFIKNRHLIE